MDDFDQLAAEADRRHKARVAEQRAAAKAALEELDLADPDKLGPRSRGWFLDTLAGAVRGPIKGLQATYGLAETIAESALGNFGDVRLNIANGRPLVEYVDPERFRQENAGADAVNAGIGAAADAFGKTETLPGQMVEGVTQFLSGYAAVTKIGRAAEVLKRAPALAAADTLARSALVSGVVFDGQEANLANLVQLAPALQNPITEYLANDEDTPELEGRLKNAVTDALGGAAVEGVIAAVKAVKRVRSTNAAAETDPTLDVTKEADAPIVDPASEKFTKDQLTLADEPGAGGTGAQPGPAYNDVRIDEALNARADKLELVDDAPATAAPEAEPVSKLEARAAELKAKAEELKKVADAEKARRAPIKDFSDDEAVKKLADELGITDAQVDELSKKVAAGEVKPEAVADLLKINPQRIDWTGVSDVEDMVGLLNALTRIFENAGLKAGSAPVTMRQVAADARSMGATFDGAVELWRKVRGLPAQVTAARTARMGSAARLKALADKAKGGNDAQSLVDFIRHVRVHAALDAVVKGSVSEIGRALRSMKEGVGVDEAVFKMANARRLRAARKAAETAAEQEARIARAKAVRAEAAAAREAAKKAQKEADEAAAKAAEAEETIEQMRERAQEALTEASTRRMRDEAKRAKETQKRVAKEAAARAREAEKAAKAAEKKAKEFEDFNNRAADATSAVDVELDGAMRAEMDEADRALKELGYSREQAVKLADMIAKGQNAMEVSLAARQGTFQKVSDWIATLYINSILSGFKTWTLNIASGIYKVVESTVERYGQAMLGGDKYDWIAANKATVALAQSFGHAWFMAGKAFREGIPQTDVLAKAEVEVRAGVSSDNIAAKVITLPSRVIITIDEFFKTLFYQQELHARAVEVAAAAARFQPTASQQRRMFEQTLRETLANPPDDLILDAIDNARYQTFQKDLESGWLRWVQSGTNQYPLLKLIVPFIKTPSNIIKQAVLERSPVAFFSAKFYRTLRSEGREARTAALRVMLGTSFMGVVADMALNGDIVGSDAGKKSLRNTADLDGVKPYSIRINGQWYQFNKIDPLGTILGLSADLSLIARHVDDVNDDALLTNDFSAGEVGTALLGAITENLTDKSFFKGLADFMAMVGGDENALKTYVQSVASGLVPLSGMQRNLAQEFDEFGRQAFTITERIMSQTPGLSDSLPVRRDILGRPQKHLDRAGWDLVSPFVVSKEDPDPVARAVAELELDYRMPPKKIEGVKLNAEQYSRLVELRGQFIYNNIKTLIDTGQWSQLPRGQRARVFREYGSLGTSYAQDTLANEYPELGSVINQYRYEKRAERLGVLEP